MKRNNSTRTSLKRINLTDRLRGDKLIAKRRSGKLTKKQWKIAQYHKSIKYQVELYKDSGDIRDAYDLIELWRSRAIEPGTVARKKMYSGEIMVSKWYSDSVAILVKVCNDLVNLGVLHKIPHRFLRNIVREIQENQEAKYPPPMKMNKRKFDELCKFEDPKVTEAFKHIVSLMESQWQVQ